MHAYDTHDGLMPQGPCAAHWKSWRDTLAAEYGPQLPWCSPFIPWRAASSKNAHDLLNGQAAQGACAAHWEFLLAVPAHALVQRAAMLRWRVAAIWPQPWDKHWCRHPVQSSAAQI